MAYAVLWVCLLEGNEKKKEKGVDTGEALWYCIPRSTVLGSPEVFPGTTAGGLSYTTIGGGQV